jgi:peptidoglycan/LPS O-acetylase OafA/YrhL
MALNGIKKMPAVELRPLTSLRFVAAMMIVLFHAKSYFHWPFLAYVPSTASFGVSFFFVLSGFILTHVYGSKPFPGYWHFIVLRFGRLWPVHMVATLVVVVSLFAGGAIIRTDSLTFQGPGLLFNRWTEFALVAGLSQSLSPYLANIYAWNSPSWSISTEFFFYLAFPWLLADIGRTWPWKLLVAAAAGIGLAAMLRFFGVPTTTPDPFAGGVIEIMTANPLGRIFEFCLGMSACIVWRDYIKDSIGSILVWSLIEALAVAIVVWWNLYVFSWELGSFPERVMECFFYVAGPAWAFAILIVAVACGRGLIGQFLGASSLVLAGEVSFSIYLFHQILMKIYMTHGWTDVQPVFFFLPLFAISILSYFCIERPARAYVVSLLKQRKISMALP